MRHIWKRVCAAAMGLAGFLLMVPMDTQAMPSFARQTGMNCNSCHIGTDNVPNFTRTGRIFAMRGYVRPTVRERLRHDSEMVEDQPQYGGDYLALNWDDFFAARLVSELAQGGRNNDGSSRDWTSRPLARMAFFYTGPVTDWLGLWTELGYLGNNSINSVSTGNTGPTGLNFYAYDEYRLSTGMDIGPGSFIGMSIGNEHPNVVTQWVFPTGLPDMWGNGQGGTGRAKEIMAISFHGLFMDRYWAQIGFVTGDNNNNWSNGSNQYGAFAWNIFRTTRNDLWLALELYRGKDQSTQMTTVRGSFICPGACPPGVTDSSLSITNTRGGTNGLIVGAPVVQIQEFNSYKLRIEHSVADRGPHSWIASAVLTGTEEDHKDGGSLERTVLGGYLRYFYNRTYGFYTTVWKDLEYDYTNAAGVKRGTYQKLNYAITLLWNPAMNFSTHLVIQPRTQNRVFDDERERYQGNGRSYSLGFEYNF